MFLRAKARSAAAAAAKEAAAAPVKQVPMSLCCHGNTYAFHYLNHPGVMAISTLLEMKGIVDMRANFTQENIEALKVRDNFHLGFTDYVAQVEMEFEFFVSMLYCRSLHQERDLSCKKVLARNKKWKIKKEFDAELARKGQIALDHDLAVNFLDLEYIDETLPRLLIEKELCQQV